MELIERTEFLASLNNHFTGIEEGEGHCILISGEAGIGKSALIKSFCKQQTENCNIYLGACDALFTPRPLAPLYDIMWQINSDLWPHKNTIDDRLALFADFYREVRNQNGKMLIVFEDIHWADEATLDFIKFFVRRIAQLPCLMLLTYRDNEVDPQHPLRNVFGQLPPDSFTRMQLTPLSKEAVTKLAEQRGYSAEDVYNITGGNPFYVTEILASYNMGVPDNIKDSILSVYNRTKERTRNVWDLMSVMPSGFEIKYLEKFEPAYSKDIEHCLAAKIILAKDGILFFKHELFRKTIEISLSPLRRIALNKQVLDLLQDSFENNGEIERIIHHAKDANEYNIVAQFAPMAAKQSASVGAHAEASKLYLSAIEYYQGDDQELLARLYEAYSYECYLTSQIDEAIAYTAKALPIWEEKNNIEKAGNCLRFLSRLWWLNNNRKQAENFAEQAITMLTDQPASAIKAMAFSNMSHLKLLFDRSGECIEWGEKAIAIAREVNDEETLSHVLNNVGSVQMKVSSSKEKGLELLRQSLSIALKNSFHEHAARAYSNLASSSIELKDYVFANKMLDEGILYCEERDLDPWKSTMLSLRASIYLETGDWENADSLTETLLANTVPLCSSTIVPLMIAGTTRMRRGDDDALALLTKAKDRAFETMQPERIIPLIIALLEYEWITGTHQLEDNIIAETSTLLMKGENISKKTAFAFWLQKARSTQFRSVGLYDADIISNSRKLRRGATAWAGSICPYEKALALFEGTEDDKRTAINLIYGLGATAIAEKMKKEMRALGINNIPRGIRKTTRSNPRFLTSRELDILHLLKENLQNKEIAAKLFISAKTVDHHISSLLFKLDVNSRTKAVSEAIRLEIVN